MNMNRYMRTYKTLLKVNFMRLLVYRGNFFSTLLSSLGWGTLSIASMILLTTNVQMVYGWKREELLLLTGLYGVIIGTFHILFSRNFERLSRIIFYGELDGILLKPLDSQFSVSMWYVGYLTVFRVLMAAGFSMYIIYTYNIELQLINVISFFVLLVFSLLLVYSIWFLILTLMIWFPRLSNLVELLFNLNDLSRFPPEMYFQFKNVFIYLLIPYTFVLVTPLKTLLNKVLVGEIFGLLFFSISLFILSRFFWRFALRSYTSASG
jgi:ABC-2 type transport system permease protein